MFDVLIKNGTIIDGTGKSLFRGDVGIKENKIVAVGDLSNEKGETEIEALGRFVCPGFIDINNHSDTYWQIFLNPDLESLAYQGITTIVGGNCGSSLAPLASAKNIESIQKWIDIKKINVNWLSLSEFFDFLSQRELSVNFATLTGHGTLRRGILNDEVRNPNPKELNFIENKLVEAMKQGSLGLSTGLIYSHARLASEEELVDLAKIVKKYKGIYTTHIRDEANEVVESLVEAVQIGQETGVKLHVSHLKIMGANNWPKMDDALAVIDHAYENGVDISFDVYPYTNTGSVLYTLLPSWVAEGGKKLLLYRLKNPITRDKVIYEMKRSGFEYDKVEIAISAMDKSLTRRKIVDIARTQGKTVEDAIIDTLLASEGRVITSMEVLNDKNVEKAIKHPLSMIATNGSGYSVEHAETGEFVHQRSFGTFMKVLEKYVLNQEIIRIEDAIKKMTSYPAEKFNLIGRGQIKKGYFADVVILDRAKITSPASREDPYQYSQGVEYLIVNGKVTIKEGVYKKIRNGEIIKG